MTRARTAGTRPLFTLVTASALAAVLSTSPNSATADKLRVGVNVTTIETVPIYLAAEGPLAGAIELTGGAIPLLTEGKVDTVTNAETQALLRSTANPDIRVILTVAEYSYRIVARRSAGVATASDLRGKKIATQLNSSAHFYIVKTLRSAGLSEADVTVVGMTPPEMPAALTRGDVDAVSIWEPAAEKSAAIQPEYDDRGLVRSRQAQGHRGPAARPYRYVTRSPRTSRTRKTADRRKARTDRAVRLDGLGPVLFPGVHSRRHAGEHGRAGALDGAETEQTGTIAGGDCGADRCKPLAGRQGLCPPLKILTCSPLAGTP